MLCPVSNYDKITGNACPIFNWLILLKLKKKYHKIQGYLQLLQIYLKTDNHIQISHYKKEYYYINNDCHAKY